jgi:1-phosphofructokinase family hexose kinase
MILTVTAHAALDRVIFIPEFLPTTRMLADHSVDYVGGKGFDVSVALSGLGVPNLAMGILAGENGRRIEFLLRGYGIPSNLTWVEGETRIAHVIVERIHHRHSHIMTPGYTVSPEDVQFFLSRYRSRVWEADWVIASGSLAPGIEADFYAQVVEVAHQAGAKALLDSVDESIRQALPFHPDILKQNVEEFRATFNYSRADVEDGGNLLKCVREVMQKHELPAIVITRGSLGLLAVTPQAAYQAACPVQQAVSAAGAGDCASAALAWRLGLGDSWFEAARWAAAAGSAGVLTEGTGELRMADVLRLLPSAVVIQNPHNA